MRGLPDFNPADKRFWPENPDPDFSPERNKRVIEDSIKKYEAYRKRQFEIFRKNLGERVDAVTTYLTGRYGAQRSRPIDRYFGKRVLAALRAKDIVSELKRVDTGQPSTLRQRVWNQKGTYLGGPKKQER